MSSFIPLFAIIIVFVGVTPALCAPFPPGPRGLPLAGNLLDMPSEKEWLTFAEWGDIYGDILSVSILGRRLVVINSAQAAIDILDKKGAIYSDRPIMGMIGELMGVKNSLVLLPYGARFRKQRRLVRHRLSDHAAMNQFSLIVEHETGRLLRRLFAKPEHFSDQIQKTIGAVLLRIIYGYEIQEENDLFLELVDRVSHYFSLATTPVRHIPDWFPGAGFKQIAQEWRATIFDMADRTHDYVKQQMAVGNGCVCFTSKLLEDDPNIKWLSVTLYTGLCDIPGAAIYAFFKAMLLFPEVQTKAQAEIRRLLSDDREQWHTVAPLGVPHSSKEYGVQSGYFIPKGSLILANIWKMLHDPAIYKQPFDFNPDRLSKMLADSSIFIVCAMVLATFNISKYSQNGVVFEPDAGHTPGNIRPEHFSAVECHPTPFKCTIKVRSEKALSLINGDGFA
ncbi:cytochrome P450 [Armillaria mellea]|nr:cytochrome P450 [Armillaria mellea]